MQSTAKTFNFYISLHFRFHCIKYTYFSLEAKLYSMRNRKSVKFQAFIDEIKNADTLNLEFSDRLFNLTVLNIKVHKENHLEFNFKDGSIVNIDL